MNRILQYLKTSPGRRLFLKTNGKSNMKMYTNVDYTISITNRRSISKYYTFLGGNLVKIGEETNVVARFNEEAEFRAVFELLWFKLF